MGLILSLIGRKSMQQNYPGKMRKKSRSLPAVMAAAAACVLFTVATTAMLRKTEPFYSHYYSFAWWSYIIFIQAFLRWRRAPSLLFDSPLQFWVLLPLSLTLWLVFEAFNFRLSNWHYIEIPSSLPVRWAGYVIAFATVLPGLFATAQFFDHLGICAKARCRPLAAPSRLSGPFFLIGTACLVLPLLLPKFFFPLVWLGFFFLFEPINYRHGGISFLRDWEHGSPGRFYLLLLAGLVCGLLWETWNFKAGAKWIYTVPFVGGWKVFEMPVLGFLGFPPFAVACGSAASTFFLLTDMMRKRLSPRVTIVFYSLGTILVILLDLLLFAGIDHFTVSTYQARVF